MAEEKKAKRAAYQKEYREKNRVKIAKQRKNHYEENKAKILQEKKEYYKKNKDRIKVTQKEYRDSTREKIAEKNRIYREANKENLKAYYKEYGQKNKEVLREKARIRKKKRRKSDSLYRMSCELRSRVRKSFKMKGWKKGSATEQLLGTDWRTAFEHIENLFTEGMSWDNHGDWHIDHIKPIASAKTEEELKLLCHYTNLQPLWAEDNLKKGAKMPYL